MALKRRAPVPRGAPYTGRGAREASARAEAVLLVPGEALGLHSISMGDATVADDHAAHAVDAHPHAHRPDVKKRLARAAGHLEAVRRMVDADRDCPEILRQIAAVRAALDATARVVLADHMESCLRGAASGEPDRAWHDLKGALETFIR